MNGVQALALYINQLQRQYWVKYAQTPGVETGINGNVLLTVLTAGTQPSLLQRDHRRLRPLTTYALLVARLIFSFNDLLVHDFVVVLCQLFRPQPEPLLGSLPGKVERQLVIRCYQRFA